VTHDPAMLALAAFDLIAALATLAFIIYAITSWRAKTREFKSRHPWL
jgi:hypothetical protein